MFSGTALICLGFFIIIFIQINVHYDSDDTSNSKTQERKQYPHVGWPKSVYNLKTLIFSSNWMVSLYNPDGRVTKKSHICKQEHECKGRNEFLRSSIPTATVAAAQGYTYQTLSPTCKDSFLNSQVIHIDRHQQSLIHRINT